MQFRSRAEAAQMLAERLAEWRGKQAVVLAVPRGGVPMGALVATALDADLDVVLVRKLRSPMNPEFALGAIDEEGKVWIGSAVERFGIDERWVRQEAERQRAVIRVRRARYSEVHSPVEITGRTAIVVDDGVATGATMTAALRAIRARNPAYLICAIAVATPGAVQQLRTHCDAVVCLHATRAFFAVGEFFRDFAQVSDEEVIDLLEQAELRRVNREQATAPSG